MIKYSAYGVFKGEGHPYRKVFHRRHNPLKLRAYLAVKLMLFPAIWVSGLIYLAYGLWSHLDGASFLLQIVANIHILSAFAIAAFVVVHVYLLTLGHGFRSHICPMVTGFDTVDLTPEEEAFLKTSEPWRLHDVPEAPIHPRN